MTHRRVVVWKWRASWLHLKAPIGHWQKQAAMRRERQQQKDLRRRMRQCRCLGW